jgi:hypothetical protein
MTAVVETVILVLRPFLLSHPRLSDLLARILIPVEKIIKIPIFGCHMCGQCVLHSTGLVCPMTCPKNLRNGPCGGVRLNNHCEVKPEMVCVWFNAYQRSQRLPWTEEMHDVRPPVDWQLRGGSSWINYATGRDQIVSGCRTEPETALAVIKSDG